MKLTSIIITVAIALFSTSIVFAQCPYDPNCINNPYGAGSPYKSNGLMNPYSQYGSPYSNKSHTNPYATNAPKVYDSNGNYKGRLSNNPYDPESTGNPYGKYGNPYGNTINNPMNKNKTYYIQGQ